MLLYVYKVLLLLPPLFQGNKKKLQKTNTGQGAVPVTALYSWHKIIQSQCIGFSCINSAEIQDKNASYIHLRWDSKLNLSQGTPLDPNPAPNSESWGLQAKTRTVPSALKPLAKFGTGSRSRPNIHSWAQMYKRLKLDAQIQTLTLGPVLNFL